MFPGGLLLTATVILSATTFGQRITTIQLDGIQYFVSRMNPYSPALNYFLSYQYCRSLGLQLASFESREKSDSLMQYLRNAGYNKYDYWTSGNRLGTDMLLWMSTGTPFNTTFDYMRKAPANDVQNNPDETPSIPEAPSSNSRMQDGRSQRPGRQSADEIISGCVTLKAPTLEWDTDDCLAVKDFICEQTRCYYYNYGSIPVSTAQGEKNTKPTLASLTSTTTKETVSETPVPTDNEDPQEQEVAANRRITLRPNTAEDVHPTTTPYTTDFISDKDDPTYNYKYASRKFPEKDSDANVVYVTAVGVHNYRGPTLEDTDGSDSTDLTTSIPNKVEEMTKV